MTSRVSPWITQRTWAIVAPRITALRVVLGMVTLIATWNAFTGRGAFFDEAIYQQVGRLLVFRQEDWNFTTWLVGSPFGYPILVGILDLLGWGIEAARMINVPFLVLATWSVYKIGHEIGSSERESLAGAAAFGLAGPVIFTGSFATYDMSALALNLISIWLVLKGTRNKNVEYKFLLGAGVTFGIAVLLKYVVIAVAPVYAALVVVRLWPYKPRLFHRLWQSVKIAYAGMLVLIPAAVIVGLYLAKFWWQMQLVLKYSGGHTTNYGASSMALLYTVLLYVGPAWLLALVGLSLLPKNRSAFTVGLVLFAGSLVMPLYHLLRLDPLALFKQVCWSLAFLGPLMGVALMRLASRRKIFWMVVTVLALISVYHVSTLRRFYPDTRPAAEYLRGVVHSWDDPILVDDVWPYRFALADTFNGYEWNTVDQWWWRNTLATPELWRDLILNGKFSRVVVEKGGAFNGKGSVFDDSVVKTLEQSGQYRLEKEFPSRVSWGNSILPPPWKGDLSAYSIVRTQIWVRIGEKEVP